MTKEHETNTPFNLSSHSLLYLSIRGLCPRCGQGRLFKNFLQLDSNCPHCGLNLEQANVGDGAIPFIMLLVGFFGVGVGIWMQFVLDASYWLQILVTFPLIMISTLILLQPCKALFLILEYRQKAGEGGANTFDNID